MYNHSEASSSWYYDSKIEQHDDEHQMIEVDRVYCLDLDAFADADWQQLAAIYQTLPGWSGYGDSQATDACPYWFGNDERHPPYLWASVEPVGLVVSGIIESNAWRSWAEQFEKHAGELPKYEIE